jgi:hypothetical protein
VLDDVTQKDDVEPSVGRRFLAEERDVTVVRRPGGALFGQEVGVESDVPSVSQTLADASSRESVSAAEIQDVGRRFLPVTFHQEFDRPGSRELPWVTCGVLSTKLSEVHAADVFEVEGGAPYASRVPRLSSRTSGAKEPLAQS